MRWWIYQKERFPLLANGLLVAAFSGCALFYSAQLSTSDLPSMQMFLVSFPICLLFFLQLRIADEFKDFEEDSTYRPYRPVPRGLIQLKELAWLFIACATIQLGLALWFSPLLIWILFIAWSYLALMSVEFFARDWLKKRPITYLWTHMLIMPIIDLFATACYWLPGAMPSGLKWFLAASFTNGLVIEIGRKIRNRDQEEEGVPTYSKLWGIKNASYVWLGCLLATALFATLAAYRTGTSTLTAIILVTAITLFTVVQKPGKTIETLSGLWTLLLYLTLGILPLLIK